MKVVNCICTNTPLSKYASVPTNNNLKSRLVLCNTFAVFCCTAQNLASTSSYCLRELKRNSKVVCSLKCDFQKNFGTFYISKRKP